MTHKEFQAEKQWQNSESVSHLLPRPIMLWTWAHGSEAMFYSQTVLHYLLLALSKFLNISVPWFVTYKRIQYL